MRRMSQHTAEADSSGHADRAWACFLACHAARDPSAPVEYLSSRDSRNGELAGGFGGEDGGLRAREAEEEFKGALRRMGV